MLANSVASEAAPAGFAVMTRLSPVLPDAVTLSHTLSELAVHGISVRPELLSTWIVRCSTARPPTWESPTPDAVTTSRAVVTVSEAVLLVTDPAGSDTVTEYPPASLSATCVRVSTPVRDPETCPPSASAVEPLYHW